MTRKVGMQVIEDHGELAFKRGARLSSCPHAGKKSATAWKNGWLKKHHEKYQLALRFK